jgi:D-sedoheptulose 7-phosphate isomerase
MSQAVENRVEYARMGSARASFSNHTKLGVLMAKQERALHRSHAANTSLSIVESHLVRLQKCLQELQADRVAQIADRLWAVAKSGGQILIAGNGGSAATASHMALDVGKSTLGRDPRRAEVRIRTIALNDPGPVITAWANDHGYERVFAEQIVTLARPGDAAVFCSVSGNSPNVVAAARAARSIGMVVIGLLGRPGGAMRELADLALVVPSEDYQIVEDAHLAISHMVTRFLITAVESTAASGRHAAQAARPLAIRKRRLSHAKRRGA